MKKLLGCFLCVMLLVFGVSALASATTITTTNIDYILPYLYLGGTPDLVTGGQSQPQQDKYAQVNWVIDQYNTSNATSYPDATFLYKIEFEEGAGWSGTWDTFPDGINYMSLKAGSASSGAGFALYLIDSTPFPTITSGVWSTKWDLSGKDISHISFWGGPSSVPEPATMLLLGSGLLGLALFSRQRFK